MARKNKNKAGVAAPVAAPTAAANIQNVTAPEAIEETSAQQPILPESSEETKSESYPVDLEQEPSPVEPVSPSLDFSFQSAVTVTEITFSPSDSHSPQPLVNRATPIGIALESSDSDWNQFVSDNSNLDDDFPTGAPPLQPDMDVSDLSSIDMDPHDREFFFSANAVEAEDAESLSLTDRLYRYFTRVLAFRTLPPFSTALSATSLQAWTSDSTSTLSTPESPLSGYKEGVEGAVGSLLAALTYSVRLGVAIQIWFCLVGAVFTYNSFCLWCRVWLWFWSLPLRVMEEVVRTVVVSAADHAVQWLNLSSSTTEQIPRATNGHVHKAGHGSGR